MTVTYNDTRFTYNNSNLTYDGLWIAPSLAGAQDPPSAILNRIGSYVRTMTGSQPVGPPFNYDELGITYNEPGRTYNNNDVGILAGRIGHYARVLAGVQPATVGELSRFWSPYIWAEYAWNLSDRPEQVGYVTHESGISAQSTRYTASVSQEHTGNETVYQEVTPNVYRRPS